LDAKRLSVKFLPIAGELHGTLVVLNDITEKTRLAEQLQQARKMEAIGLLAGGIAHDFNNILTAILGNVSLAKMYLRPDNKSYMRLEEAEKASMRAKDLTLQLLTFARGGAPVKKKASLAEIVGECCRYTLKEPAVRCETKLEEDLWPVDLDKGQISQALQNLLANAEQSMPAGGNIRIRVQNRNLEEDHDLPLEPGRYVELALADQGMGIPEENLPRIFDPYFTTKNRRSGLGLTIAYSIVKNHKGHIRVESKPGEGTVFYVYLPASSESETDKRAVEPSVLRKCRVLVMDDEVFVRDVVGEMLEFIGFKAEFAADGTAAIKQYEDAMAAGGRFDAVIMDLTIADGMGGREAIKRLLEIDPEAKVIVSSGYSDDPVMSDYKSYGFKGVAVKPFKLDELNKTLHEVITSGD
jgi:nitrogen-specific signal transduction histidine kinase/CheY-like chemotaxis protein